MVLCGKTAQTREEDSLIGVFLPSCDKCNQHTAETSLHRPPSQHHHLSHFLCPPGLCEIRYQVQSQFHPDESTAPSFLPNKIGGCVCLRHSLQARASEFLFCTSAQTSRGTKRWRETTGFRAKLPVSKQAANCTVAAELCELAWKCNQVLQRECGILRGFRKTGALATELL